VHIRAVAFRLFDSAWRDELIAENPVARVSVPDIEQVSKARAILTDEEIRTLVTHPDVDGEIRLLVLLSRTVAGPRGRPELTGLDGVRPGLRLDQKRTRCPRGFDRS
jgi:hypothetical protein